MTTPSPDRPFRRRLLVNTGAVAASNGWTMVVTFVSLPLLLTGLGVTGFGTWVLLQTFSALNGWFSLADLGLGTAGTREVARRRALEDGPGAATAAGTTLALHGVLGVVAGVLIAILGPWTLPAVFRTPQELEGPLTVAILAFAVQVGFDLTIRGYQAVLDGHQRVDLARLIEVARRTLVAIATAATALITEDLGRVAIASAAASAVAAVGGPFLLARTAPGTRPAPRWWMVKVLFAYGRTVALLRPLGVLHRTIDRFVVGAVLGPGAVSLVEIATQLQNGTDAAMAASSFAVVPGAAHLDAQGERTKMGELLRSGTRYVLLVTWPVAVLTAVLAAPAIDLWVGDAYGEAAGLTALAVIALAVVAPAQVASNLLLGTGRASAILRVVLVAIVVNVALSVALVHAIGLAGAFIATIASAVITVPALLWAALSDVGIRARGFLHSSVLPATGAPVVAGLVAGAVVVLPLGPLPTLLVGGVAGTVAAAGGAWRWGLESAERTAITARIRRRR